MRRLACTRIGGRLFRLGESGRAEGKAEGRDLRVRRGVAVSDRGGGGGVAGVHVEGPQGWVSKAGQYTAKPEIAPIPVQDTVPQRPGIAQGATWGRIKDSRTFLPAPRTSGSGPSGLHRTYL